MIIIRRSLGRFIYFELEIRFRSHEITNYFRSLGRWKGETGQGNRAWPGFSKTYFLDFSGAKSSKTTVLRKVHRLEAPGGNRAWLGFSKTSFLDFSGAKSSKTTVLRKVHRLESPRRNGAWPNFSKTYFLNFSGAKSSKTTFKNRFFGLFGREKLKNATSMSPSATPATQSADRCRIRTTPTQTVG